MRRPPLSRRFLGSLSLLALFWSVTPGAQSNAPREEFTAVAMSIGGPTSSPVAGQLDITIDRWSSDAERKQLVAALAKGQDQLLDVLQDMKPVGRIRTPSSLGWDLRYAAQRPTAEGGRQIVIATDRPISFWEAVNRPRLSDYPFTLIEMRLDRNGEGEGKLSRATRVIKGSDDMSVMLENYESQPVALSRIQSKKR